MKVLVVSSGKPTSQYPLVGNFEFDQAIALASIGVDIDYFAVDLRSYRRKRRWGISHGVNDGVNWHVISIPLGAVPIKFLCFCGKMALLVLYKKVFKTRHYRPDIIHAHFTEIGYMAAYLSKKTDIPLVITEHSSLINRFPVSEEILKCAIGGYGQASKVIAVSNALSKNIFKNTGDNAVVVPNMIKLDVFYNAKKKNHKGFKIVTTANLVPGKRISLLVDSFSSHAQEHLDWYLDIIGDGPLKDELEKTIKRNGLRERIRLMGYCNSKEIAKIYEYSDCFVLPSSSETFGVVYIEAMAAGLPVIATKCGGPEDFVNEKNGILVDTDDSIQLTEALLKMSKTFEKYSEDYLRRFAKENYAPQIIANRLYSIYKEIIKNG